MNGQPVTKFVASGFGVATKQPGPDGPEQLTVLQLLTPFHIYEVVFNDESWQQFREFVDDPEGAAARSRARAQIEVPHLRPVPQNGDEAS